MKKKFGDKKAIEMSFNWIFALLVGGFILLLAIYGATKFIQTSEQTLYTETAASLISLFDPLETGLASGKASELIFAKKSRLFFTCSETSNTPFGLQTVSFSEQTFGDKFGEAGQHISIKDKYVFTDDVLEGKILYYFSKPFFMSYRVGDLVMLYSDNEPYCVYGSSEHFKDNIEDLKLANIIFSNSSSSCKGISVCFSSISKSCDIKIFENENYVLKKGRKMYYEGDLLYAALFSSPDIYECNVKRIKQRYNSLGKVYLEKIKILQRNNCQPQIGPKLAASLNYSITNSKSLQTFFSFVEDINAIHERAKEECKLYYSTGSD
ncbi:MAG: hypothetical protein AABX16_01260 [Nanoarchaeota archaeon]